MSGKSALTGVASQKRGRRFAELSLHVTTLTHRVYDGNGGSSRGKRHCADGGCHRAWLKAPAKGVGASGHEFLRPYVRAHVTAECSRVCWMCVKADEGTQRPRIRGFLKRSDRELQNLLIAELQHPRGRWWWLTNAIWRRRNKVMPASGVY